MVANRGYGGALWPQHNFVRRRLIASEYEKTASWTASQFHDVLRSSMWINPPLLSLSAGTAVPVGTVVLPASLPTVASVIKLTKDGERIRTKIPLVASLGHAPAAFLPGLCELRSPQASSQVRCPKSALDCFSVARVTQQGIFHCPRTTIFRKIT